MKKSLGENVAVPIIIRHLSFHDCFSLDGFVPLQNVQSAVSQDLPLANTWKLSSPDAGPQADARGRTAALHATTTAGRRRK